MSKQKLEKVLELMINEENAKASDLLHEIFVEKARKIYSKMIKEDEDLERDLNEADWDKEYDFDTSDDEDDFEKDTNEFDVSDLDDEIDDEEMYEAEDEFADEDEVDPAHDLADEMSGDHDLEPSDDDLNGDEFADADADADIDADAGEVEEVFMNVEDALAELKAAFADIVGDAGESDEDEGEDEFDSADYDYESDEDEDEGEHDEKEIKESVKLSKVSSPKKVSDEGKTSPFAKVKDSDKLGKPLKNAIKTSAETGGKPTKAKPIGVPGPQDVGAKLKPASVRKPKA